MTPPSQIPPTVNEVDNLADQNTLEYENCQQIESGGNRVEVSVQSK